MYKTYPINFNVNSKEPIQYIDIRVPIHPNIPISYLIYVAGLFS